MSADPAEVLPLCPMNPQMTESELTALMTRGRVESRIAAKLRLLQALQHVPESTCAEQRDRLSGEIGTLTILLDLPDDELVVAAPNSLRTSRSRPVQDNLTPPVVLYEVLPVREESDEAPTEEVEPDIHTRISQTKATLLQLIQHASTLPEEDMHAALDAINDVCDEAYGAIGQVVEDIELVDTVVEDELETGELTEVEGSTEPPFESTQTFYGEADGFDGSLLAQDATPTTSLDSISTTEAPVVREIDPLLPPDFREQVLALVNATPTIYIKDVVRNIFGAYELDKATFSAQYNELQMMIGEGLLQPRGPKGFSLPEEGRQLVVARRKKEMADTPSITKEDALDRRLRAAHIPASPTIRPRRKGNK